MLCSLSLAIFSSLCFGIIKKLNLVLILANERRCAETVHVQIRICIIGKDNINLLLSHNNTVVLKEKFSFFILLGNRKSWSAAGKHRGAGRESESCSGTVQQWRCNHLVVGQNISLLSAHRSTFLPPTIQLVGVGLHWIYFHSLVLTFALLLHWLAVWLVPGVRLVYWCLTLETTELVFSL